MYNINFSHLQYIAINVSVVKGC